MNRYLLRGIALIVVFIPNFLLAQLTVDFSFSPDYAYSGKTIHFTSQVSGGTNNNYVYDWDFNDGTLHSELQNPTHIFSNITGCGIQPFDVKLTVTDIVQDSTGSITKTVHVKRIHYPPPTISFEFSADYSCSGAPVQFTSHVTGCDSNLYIYDWNFNDNGPHSSLKNPAHTFDSYGCDVQNYNVVLTICDTSNNSTVYKTANHTVHIKQRPNPQLLDTANSVPFSNCYNYPPPTPNNPEFRIEVINQTENGNCIVANTYSINWGDGTDTTGLSISSFPLEHTYHQLGAYNLVFKATGTNGCQGETNYLVKNEANPGIGVTSAGQTVGCAPITFPFYVRQFKNNSPSTTYIWDFDDGTPQIIWTKDSIYNNDSVIYHTFNTTSCLDPDGTFTVKLTATNSCKSTPSTVGGIEVWSKGSTMISNIHTIGCAGDCIEFNNTSIPGYGPNCSTATTYHWDFGNGNIYNGSSPPCQVYDTAGTYNLTVISTNNCGNDTLICPVTIYALATAMATPTFFNGCKPLNVTFNNQSTGGGMLSYTWSVTPNTYQFTNGTNIHSINPSIKFLNKGVYTVTLQTENNCNSDTAVFHINVFDRPGVTLPTVYGDCTPFIYTMNPTYTGNGDPIISYLWMISPSTGWNYIPPSTPNSSNPTISFNSAGDYTMSVIVTNSCGPTQGVSNTFHVGLPAIAFAGNDTAVCLNSGNFKLNGIPPGGTWAGPHVQNGYFYPTETGNFTLTYTNGSGNCSSTDSLLITVKPVPIVNAGADTSVCLDVSPFILYGYPAGGNWTGNGIINSTGLFSPVVAGSGISIVTYTYTDNSTECVIFDTKNINVNPLPVVEAGSNITLCNQPIGYNLTGYSPPGGIWSGMNVNANGVFTPNGIGTFTLTYSFTNPQTQCSNSDSIIVNVVEPSLANAGNDTSVCINSSVIPLFGIPSGGVWSGLHVSNGEFTPSEAGNFVLTYSWGNGTCFTQDAKTITVMQLPVVNAGNDIAICIDIPPFQLQGIPTGGIWSGNGIIDSITGLYNPGIAGPGISNITYVVTDTLTNCSNFDNIQINVNLLPLVNAPDTTFCNQSFPQQLIGNPQGGIWTGNNVTSSGIYTPNGIGQFFIYYSFTDNHSCTAIDTMTITVVNPDTSISAGTDRTLCANESLWLTGTPPGGTWSGNNVNVNGFFDPVAPGDYTLVYSNGIGSCLTMDSIIIHVLSVPTSNFQASTECLGDTTLFQDNSLGGGVPIVAWYWDFDDNTFSVEQNPKHVYINSGTYNVKLRIANSNSCYDSLIRQVSVNTLPDVSFSLFLPACINSPIHFNNYTTNAISYSWDFGDGTTSTDFEPYHFYTNPGNYLVKLEAYSAYGCYKSDTTTIYITPPPPIPFFSKSTNQGCGPLPLHLSINDTLYQNSYANFYWDFGNGQTSANLIPPDTLYYSSGIISDTIYYISFISKNFCDSLIFKDSLIVSPIPLPSFVVQHDWDCSPINVEFKNFTVGQPINFYWDFGDGSQPSDSINPHHTFTTGNTTSIYYVKLIATNECGRDTSQQTILVKPNTVDAFFKTDNFIICQGDTVNFTNYSTDTTYNITNCFWDFGDGETSASWNAAHSYVQDGIYQVRLHVDNGCGHDDYYDSITVNAQPQLNIYFNNEVCVEDTVNFNYSSNVLLSDKLWDFGDSCFSTSSNPTHCYNKPGNYQIIFKGVAAEGPRCYGSLQKRIIINPVPQAIITPTAASGCAPFTVNFIGDNGSYHTWDFGDGTPSTSNSMHTFVSPGLYNVTLTSEYDNSCKDFDTTFVRVFPLPSSKFIIDYNQSDLNSFPASVIFSNQSVGATNFFWDFDNGDTSSMENPTTIYNNIGNYFIRLIAANQYNCTDTLIIPLHLFYNNLYIPNALWFSSPKPEDQLFTPKGIGLTLYHIIIYNRWDNKIWESTKIDNNGSPIESWDGTYKGERVPEGTYYWVIKELLFDNGSTKPNNAFKNTGTIQVIY